MNQDAIQKVSEWMGHVLQRTSQGSSDVDQWSKALARVVVPIAAGGGSADLCYWALIGYCRLHHCGLPSEWPAGMADTFNKLLQRVKARAEGDSEPTQLLAAAVSMLLELSVEFAGRNPREWDAHLLAYA